MLYTHFYESSFWEGWGIKSIYDATSQQIGMALIISEKKISGV
jgi:hypothetical protein